MGTLHQHHVDFIFPRVRIIVHHIKFVRTGFKEITDVAVIAADGKEVVGNITTRNITNFLFMPDSL